MPVSLLGLQAGIAGGSEPTYDGQAMRAGTHLRWAATPELGFPPGGYWLLRRVATKGEKQIEPPRAVVDAIRAASNASAPSPSAYEPRCRCDCVPPPYCCCNRTCDHPCKCGGGNGNGNGGGTTSGPGWPVGGKPVWGDPGDGGWSLWSQPFTLPVTAINWPARYAGALDPATHSAALVRARDVAECHVRLHGLAFVNGMSAAATHANFEKLRAECFRLVHGWPSVKLFDVGLAPSQDGAHAPSLTMGVVEQLYLTALSPYAARVLGLYFVDEEAAAGTTYDYCIVGVWGGVPVAPRTYTPGLAPSGALSRGNAKAAGLTISVAPGVAQFYTWMRDDANGAYIGKTDPSAPPDVAAACAAAVAFVPQSAQPPAMLAARTPGFAFPFSFPPINALVCDIALSNPAATIDVNVAGNGTVTALAGGTVVATATFGTSSMQTLTLAATDPSGAPLDELRFTTSGYASTVVVGNLVAHAVPNDVAGVLYALVQATHAMQAPPVPPKPVALFRKREANVELPGPSIVTRSFFNVQFAVQPLTAADYTGNPTDGATLLPPPTRAIGYVARRADGDVTHNTLIERILAAAPQATPPGSPLLPAPYVIAFSDSGLPDPASGYAYCVASFGIFGERSAFGPWSASAGVERIAAAPTSLSLAAFRNSASDGGTAQPAVNPAAWVGGTLDVTAAWSGGALLMYPDVKSARLSVWQLEANDVVPANTLATKDFAVPAPAVSSYTLQNLIPDPNFNVVYAVASPPFPQIDADGPAASLTLTGVLADGTPGFRAFHRAAQYGAGELRRAPAGHRRDPARRAGVARCDQSVCIRQQPVLSGEPAFRSRSRCPCRWPFRSARRPRAAAARCRAREPPRSIRRNRSWIPTACSRRDPSRRRIRSRLPAHSISCRPRRRRRCIRSITTTTTCPITTETHRSNSRSTRRPVCRRYPAICCVARPRTGSSSPTSCGVTET